MPWSATQLEQGFEALSTHLGEQTAIWFLELDLRNFMIIFQLVTQTSPFFFREGSGFGLTTDIVYYSIFNILHHKPCTERRG